MYITILCLSLPLHSPHHPLPISVLTLPSPPLPISALTLPSPSSAYLCPYTPLTILCLSLPLHSPHHPLPISALTLPSPSLSCFKATCCSLFMTYHSRGLSQCELWVHLKSSGQGFISLHCQRQGQTLVPYPKLVKTAKPK